MSIFSQSEFDSSRLSYFENKLIKKYPFIKKECIGYTALSKPINAYTIGDNGSAVICAAFHALERVTSAILTRYIFEKAEEYKNGANLSFTAIPMINPDGVDISIHGIKAAEKFLPLIISRTNGDTQSWQANARGVDLNHNFNAGFLSVRKNEIKNGYILSGPTRFGGGSPESEKETRALVNFCKKNNFSAAVALHSQGREIYYDFKNHAQESEKIAKQMSKLSGYILSSPENIATGGGFKDWFCEYFHRIGITLEIGLGKNPLDKCVADTEYDLVAKMLDVVVLQHG